MERTELNLIMCIWTFYFSSSNHTCFDHLSRETTQSTALEQEPFDIRSLSRVLSNLWLLLAEHLRARSGAPWVRKLGYLCIHVSLARAYVRTTGIPM